MDVLPSAACQETCHFVLREELSTLRDVKNVDRSGDVYENKGSQYIMPETRKVRVSEKSTNVAKLGGFVKANALFRRVVPRSM